MSPEDARVVGAQQAGVGDADLLEQAATGSARSHTAGDEGGGAMMRGHRLQEALHP